MMRNDELVFLILKMYPALEHGRDFWVAHPVGPTIEADGQPTQIGEAWIVQWKAQDVAQPNDTEIATLRALHGAEYQTATADAIARAKRAELLTQADYLVESAIDDADTSKETAARAYRKALRDLTEQAGYPLDIEWPPLPA